MRYWFHRYLKKLHCNKVWEIQDSKHFNQKENGLEKYGTETRLNFVVLAVINLRIDVETTCMK